MWHTKKLAQPVSQWTCSDLLMLRPTYRIKFITVTCMSLLCMQDDNGVVEEEDTDYVDIPIKVVTQRDVAES